MREALAAYLGVGAEMVVPTNGGAEALFLAARAAGTAGRALVLEPTFSEYAAAARASGMEPVRRVARQREAGFEWDPTPLRDLAGVSVVFLCNPNNPTGDLLGRDEVLEVAAHVRKAGAVLVVDEAFADFVPGISVADMVDQGLWVARSFTKFFAIPGLRLGCLVCDDAGRVQALQPSWAVNAVAAAAGIAAVGDRGFADASVVEVARLRKDLFVALDAISGVQPFPGAANFLLVRGPEGLASAARQARGAGAGLRAFPWARTGVLPGSGQECRGERAARRGDRGGAVAVRALILGGARSGKSAFAERLASALGGERVLYVATAIEGGDEDLQRRIRLHSERRPAGWGTLEIGDLEEVLNAAEKWDAVLLDSLTLWVSADGEETGAPRVRAVSGQRPRISACRSYW